MKDDSGFTLIEVMVAGMLTMLLAIPAFMLLQHANEFAAATRSRFALNAEARQVWTLLGSGSANLSGITNQTDGYGFPYVRGMRSLQSAPAGSSLRSSGKFVLSDNPLALAGDSFPSLTVTCTAPAAPIPDCISTETHSIQGWLGSDPALSVSGRIANVVSTLTDPFQAQRPNVPPRTATERYRSIFTLNSEAAP
jgi:type II secretory pathway pseudopilin PulG